MIPVIIILILALVLLIKELCVSYRAGVRYRELIDERNGFLRSKGIKITGGPMSLAGCADLVDNAMQRIFLESKE